MGKKNKNKGCDCEDSCSCEDLGVDNTFMDMSVSAEGQTARVTVKITEFGEPDVTWCYLLYKFYGLLKSLGYDFSEETDANFRRLINSGMSDYI